MDRLRTFVSSSSNNSFLDIHRKYWKVFDKTMNRSIVPANNSQAVEDSEQQTSQPDCSSANDADDISPLPIQNDSEPETEEPYLASPSQDILGDAPSLPIPTVEGVDSLFPFAGIGQLDPLSDQPALSSPLSFDFPSLPDNIDILPVSEVLPVAIEGPLTHQNAEPPPPMFLGERYQCGAPSVAPHNSIYGQPEGMEWVNEMYFHDQQQRLFDYHSNHDNQEMPFDWNMACQEPVVGGTPNLGTNLLTENEHHCAHSTPIEESDSISPVPDVNPRIIDDESGEVDIPTLEPEVEPGQEIVPQQSTSREDSSPEISDPSNGERMLPAPRNKQRRKQRSRGSGKEDTAPVKSCHICAQNFANVGLDKIFCTSVERRRCKKAVCLNCIYKHNWQVDAKGTDVVTNPLEFVCPHCLNLCDELPWARCVRYQGRRKNPK